METTQFKIPKGLMEKSKKGFKEWASLSLNKRIKKLSKVTSLLDNENNRIVETLKREIDMDREEAKKSTKKTCELVKGVLSLSKDALKETQTDHGDYVNIKTYKPHGTVLSIVAWNHPVMVTFRSIIPALVSGNSVIIKPSEYTYQLGKVFSDIFSKMDLPEGTVQVVNGGRETRKELVKDENVDMVFFTGNSNNAISVYENCAPYLKKLVIEGSSKDIMIVDSNKKEDEMVDIITNNFLRHSGQLCSSVRFIYLPKDNIQTFCKKIRDKMRELTSNSAKRYVYLNQDVKKLTDLYNDAIYKGARVVFEKRTKRNFGPTVLTNINEKMLVEYEDFFGPLLLIKTFASQSELLNELNKSYFGLNMSYWTNDVNKAIEISKNVKVGTFTVNMMPRTDYSYTWHGVKFSGLGYTLGKEGLREFTYIQNLRIKK